MSSASGHRPARGSEAAPVRGRIVVAMSGGVDSAVAAALLKDEGWDVAGVTFKLFCYGDAAGGAKACCGLEGVRDAQAAARRLGIPHVVLDLEELFRREVMDDFVQEYAAGRTPNPCIQCNTHVKFGPLLRWAERQGADHIATGHYVAKGSLDIDGESHALLARAEDDAKDQSYVLWGVEKRVIERTVFPLDQLRKSDVRDLARARDLPVWDKAESQDICFVEGRDYTDVLRAELGADHPLFRPGPILDREGRQVGEHPGLARYTVGQRRGIGVSAEEPWRVLGLEPETNTLRVGRESDLASRGLLARDLNLFVPHRVLEAGEVEAKIRYRHPPVPARVIAEGERLRVEFREPQRAVAPGQSCVLYRGGLLLAGGRIERGLPA